MRNLSQKRNKRVGVLWLLLLLHLWGDLFGSRLILPTYCIAVHNAPSTYDARGVGARSSHDFLRPDHHPIQGRPVAAIRAAEVLGAWIEISVSFHVNMFTPT